VLRFVPRAEGQAWQAEIGTGEELQRPQRNHAREGHPRPFLALPVRVQHDHAADPFSLQSEGDAKPCLPAADDDDVVHCLAVRATPRRNPILRRILEQGELVMHPARQCLQAGNDRFHAAELPGAWAIAEFREICLFLDLTQITARPSGQVMPQQPQPSDLLESIVGVAAGSALGQLRAQRPEIVRHTQGSHDVLLFPADPGGLSLAERALVAARVAELSGHAGLAEHYRRLLAEHGNPPHGERQDTVLRHVARVTTMPGTALPSHIETLRAVGLDARDVVALTQIVAFVSYQVRAAVGLALLAQEKAV
jgi:uncharacterized protein YciW